METNNKLLIPLTIILSVLFISLAWILSPVDFSIDISMDNETKESINSMSKSLVNMSGVIVEDFIEYNSNDCISTDNNTLICRT